MTDAIAAKIVCEICPFYALMNGSVWSKECGGKRLSSLAFILAIIFIKVDVYA